MKKESKRTLYNNKVNRNKQNTKCLGSAIYNIDTSRGCTHNCESCYAKKSAFTKEFTVPVRVEEFVGKRQDQAWYRIGNSGDPAFDWKHSEKLIKKNEFKKFFCVTKLQSIKGFTGFFENLQVSVDTLNEKHYQRTLDNIEKLLKKFPKVKIMLRIRSVSTTSLHLILLQQKAVDFANLYNLPVLETRVRFNRKDSIEKYQLDSTDYFMSKGKQTKPVWGKRFLTSAKKYYDCDLNGAKCENCGNCTQPWTDEQFEREGEFIAPTKSKGAYKEAA